MRTTRLSALIATAGLLLAGCGGGSDRPASSKCTPLAPGTTTASSTGHPDETMLLSNVSIETNACADRVEFTFKQRTPEHLGYRISYLPADRALVEDGSGAPIRVKGNAYLVVRLEPAATADLSGPELVRTYTGPRRLTAPENARFVREIVKSGDFEAVLTWVIGVGEQRAFHVDASGTRLVVAIG